MLSFNRSCRGSDTYAERRLNEVSHTSGATANGRRDATRVIEHINNLLKDVEAIQNRLPLKIDGNDDLSFYNAARDGVLFCELLNKVMPDSIQLNKINRDFSNENKRYFLMLENQIIVLQAAQKLGCKLVNVGPVDLVEGRSYLILGLLWQIVKTGLLSRIAKISGHVKSEDNSDVEYDLIDESENALLDLIRNHVTLPDDCNSISMLIKQKDAISELLYLAGADESICLILRESQDDFEYATSITEVADILLKEKNLIEVKDIVQVNTEMLSLFLASILELVINRKQKVHLRSQPDDESADVPDQTMLPSMSEDQGAVSFSESGDLSENTDDCDLLENLKVLSIEDVRNESDECCDHFKLIKECENRLKEFERQNFELEFQVLELQAELEISKHKIETVDNSDSYSAISDSESTVGTLVDDIYRRQRHPSSVIVEDKNAARFRKILLNSTDFEKIAQAIYGDLSLEEIQRGSMKSGLIRKKDRHALKWRHRFTVLRDNFLFCYKENAKPIDKPSDIFHVDDALIRVMFEVRSMDDPVISIEIASTVNPFYLYLSAPAGQLHEWKDEINKAAAWWLA